MVVEVPPTKHCVKKIEKEPLEKSNNVFFVNKSQEVKSSGCRIERRALYSVIIIFLFVCLATTSAYLFYQNALLEKQLKRCSEKNDMHFFKISEQNRKHSLHPKPKCRNHPPKKTTDKCELKAFHSQIERCFKNRKSPKRPSITEKCLKKEVGKCFVVKHPNTKAKIAKVVRLLHTKKSPPKTITFPPARSVKVPRPFTLPFIHRNKQTSDQLDHFLSPKNDAKPRKYDLNLPFASSNPTLPYNSIYQQFKDHIPKIPEPTKIKGFRFQLRHRFGTKKTNRKNN